MNETIPSIAYNNLEPQPKTTPLAQIAYAAVDHQKRRADALAEIQQMHDELLKYKTEIEQLKADLHREQDRCVMMVEERNKYRTDADLLRTQLMKVCTTVANIGLLTKEAEAIVLTVTEHASQD